MKHAPFKKKLINKNDCLEIYRLSWRWKTHQSNSGNFHRELKADAGHFQWTSGNFHRELKADAGNFQWTSGNFHRELKADAGNFQWTSGNFHRKLKIDPGNSQWTSGNFHRKLKIDSGNFQWTSGNFHHEPKIDSGNRKPKISSGNFHRKLDTDFGSTKWPFFYQKSQILEKYDSFLTIFTWRNRMFQYFGKYYHDYLEFTRNSPVCNIPGHFVTCFLPLTLLVICQHKGYIRQEKAVQRPSLPDEVRVRVAYHWHIWDARKQCRSQGWEEYYSCQQNKQIASQRQLLLRYSSWSALQRKDFKLQRGTAAIALPRAPKAATKGFQLAQAFWQKFRLIFRNKLAGKFRLYPRLG